MKRFTVVLAVIVAALTVIPSALAWSDSLVKKSVVCDLETQTQVVTVTYTNLENGSGLNAIKNRIDVFKVNGVAITPVTVNPAGGSADFVRSYPGTQTGNVTITLSIRWTNPILHGFDFSTDSISKTVTLYGGCVRQEEPPVEPPVPPQINREGVCIIDANGAASFRDVTAEEREQLVASGAAVYALVDASGAIHCDFPNTVVVTEEPVVSAPVAPAKPKAKPPVKKAPKPKAKPPVKKAPAPAPKPEQLPFTL